MYFIEIFLVLLANGKIIQPSVNRAYKNFFTGCLTKIVSYFYRSQNSAFSTRESFTITFVLYMTLYTIYMYIYIYIYIYILSSTDSFVVNTRNA